MVCDTFSIQKDYCIFLENLLWSKGITNDGPKEVKTAKLLAS
jgi:hypothetical protein